MSIPVRHVGIFEIPLFLNEVFNESERAFSRNHDY